MVARPTGPRNPEFARLAAYDRAMLLALDVGNTNITVGTIREADVTLVGARR